MLNIDEKWIKSRLKISHNNLEDIKSISLPGTYHEKISLLGNSLKNFTRLKSLDLSRNALTSLKGIESLKILKKLNLYYNNIQFKKDLNLLIHNPKLEEIDLRLNDVTKNEPDYRLFLIYLLPNLRRIDDRKVDDSERKAALMHFTTDYTINLNTEKLKSLENENTSHSNPRIIHVNSLAKGPNGLNSQNSNILDLISHTEQNQVPKITGSSTKEVNFKNYSSKDAMVMDKLNFPFSNERSTEFKVGEVAKSSEEVCDSMRRACNLNKNEDFNQDNVHETQRDDDTLCLKYPNIISEVAKNENSNKKVHFSKKINNSSVQDEIEAYMSYKTKGYFTPAPEENKIKPNPSFQNSDELTENNQNSMNSCSVVKAVQKPSGYQGDEELEKPKPVKCNNASFHKVNVPFSETFSTLQDDSHNQNQLESLNCSDKTKSFIVHVSDLTDRYWNGAKSLINNPKFSDSLIRLINQQNNAENSTETGLQYHNESRLLDEISLLEKELNFFKNESQKSQEKQKELQREGSKCENCLEELMNDSVDDLENENSKISSLKRNRNISILQTRLKKSLDINKKLENELAICKQSNMHKHNSEDISSDTINLRQENEDLKIKLKRHEQLQKLTDMLQESHKSLIETNSHLLWEIEKLKKA